MNEPTNGYALCEYGDYWGEDCTEAATGQMLDQPFSLLCSPHSAGMGPMAGLRVEARAHG